VSIEHVNKSHVRRESLVAGVLAGTQALEFRSVDVIVVDVRDDEQIDVTLTVGVGRQLCKTVLELDESVVGAGVNEQMPDALANRTLDQQAVAVGGG